MFLTSATTGKIAFLAQTAVQAVPLTKKSVAGAAVVMVLASGAMAQGFLAPVGGGVGGDYQYSTPSAFSTMVLELSHSYNDRNWIGHVSTRIIHVSDDTAMHRAFDEIGLPREDGFALLEKAKAILDATSFPCTDAVPMLAHDLEENVTYLTVRLYTKADFIQSMELDSVVTRRLIEVSSRIPERLSFAVYNMENNAA